MQQLELALEKEMKWRSYFRFVNYEWDTCQKWNSHWDKLKKTTSKPDEEISRRIFFRDNMEPTFDLYLQLSEQEKLIFI